MVEPVLRAGDALGVARAAMVMVHGRGASATSILSHVKDLPLEGFAVVAPEAANAAWYPNRFMEPIESNEPYLGLALQWLDDLVSQLAEANIPHEKIILLGFSQGACLTTEYAARHARRFGGVVGLSGGLIGPSGTPRDYAGSFQRTPIFLGCSDSDSHIPKERVMETRDVYERMGANVTMRLYPNMDHSINADELQFVASMMKAVLSNTSGAS